MEEHHIEEVSQMQQQHQEHIEELNRQMEKDKKQLTDEAQLKQQELHVSIAPVAQTLKPTVAVAVA